MLIKPTFFPAQRNKAAEIDPNQVDGITIPAKSVRFTISAFGLEDSWSGCEGSFEIADPNGGTVCKIRFCSHSPIRPSYNQFDVVTASANRWMASFNGGYFGNDGPLGNVNVTIVKVGN